MKHILIVDDDHMNCILAEHALNAHYKTTAVHSGKEALDFLENEIPDLILLDLEMPEMNGKEVLARMKGNEKWTKIPIIFLTATSDSATEAACLNLGADDFISKPFVPPVMTSRVSRSLELLELRKNLETQLDKKTKQVEEATLKTMTDALTGLHNRLYLEHRLQELISNETHGTLFMIDLDNFKSINDTYGHIIGDKTLQHFAHTLKRYARENDIVCRLAGDEFVTFYPDLIDKSVISAKAEGIIKLFADKMGELGYGGIVSCSIGIMITHGDEDFKSLYSKADKSLYFVKNNGKNAYHFYGEQKETLTEINTEIDLDNVHRMLEGGVDSLSKIFQTAYSEFSKIYDFVMRGVIRKKQQVQLLLFTINPKEKLPNINLETAMDFLETSLSETLRAMDAGTKYSSSQYIVMLIDADIENGKKVAQRVIDNFYRTSPFSIKQIVVRYDIETLQPPADMIK